MVVAIPTLVFPCGFKDCTEEFKPEDLGDHFQSERYYLSHISYLRSWIGAHVTGGSSLPVSKKRKADECSGNGSVGNSPKDLPVNNSPKSVGNIFSVRQGSPIQETRIKKGESPLFQKVVITSNNTSPYGV